MHVPTSLMTRPGSDVPSQYAGTASLVTDSNPAPNIQDPSPTPSFKPPQHLSPPSRMPSFTFVNPCATSDVFDWAKHDEPHLNQLLDYYTSHRSNQAGNNTYTKYNIDLTLLIWKKLTRHSNTTHIKFTQKISYEQTTGRN